MGIDSFVSYVNLTLEVFFLDLLLSGDNAVVIALACRSLPDRQKRQAMLLGTGIAILLRVLLTLVASAVLQVPLLKLLGGVALTVIAIQLTLDDPYAVIGDNEKLPGGGAGRADLLSVIGTVVVADLVMSTDKVVALAAVAKGSVAVLALGLLLSVPLLMFGSWYVTALLKRYPVLPRLGGAMLGWFAGDIAVSDPLYAGWIEQQSPALSVVVPVLVAAYVLLQSRIIEQSRASATALRPAHEPRPIKSGQALIADTAFVQSSSAAAKPPTASRAAVVPAHESDSPVHRHRCWQRTVATSRAGLCVSAGAHGTSGPLQIEGPLRGDRCPCLRARGGRRVVCRYPRSSDVSGMWQLRAEQANAGLPSTYGLGQSLHLQNAQYAVALTWTVD